MLNQALLDTLATYTESMQSKVRFVVQSGQHPKRTELTQFLSDFCRVNSKLSWSERDIPALLRSPISFLLESAGEDTGIRFSGIPGGHEFNSLVLAVLQASGTPIKLDEGLKTIVSGIREPMSFEIVVSLSCNNCPDVVQALNQFALLNPGIRAEMIDGGLYPEFVAEKEIQGVPVVFLNGELFGSGKVDPGQLVHKLLERSPKTAHAGARPSLPLQDVTVIGGGPAGVSAAVYSARKGLKVTLIAERFGGQVKDTMAIENLISIPKTTGPEVVGGLHEHLKDYDVALKEHLRVMKIQDGHCKTLTLSSDESITTRTVIFATGAQWRELGIPGEKENLGNGVAYCPHCDGPFFKGQDVAVIGGGNSGLEAALDLSGIVKSVTVFEFLPELKADKILIEQALSRPNILLRKHVIPTEITSASGKVDGVRYKDRGTGELHHETLAGVFVQIGLVPNSQLVEGLLDLNEQGEVIIDEKCRTTVAGFFACGDVTSVPYKQIVLAMGEGSKASIAAFEFLLNHKIPAETALHHT